jgi:hypothetical protein
MAKRQALICDLDGTLASVGERSPYDAARCEVDLLNAPVAECLRMARGIIRIIFVSGRQEKDRAPTVAWLKKHMLWDENVDYDLFMRATGDVRNDAIVKEEIYRIRIEPYFDVRFVLDDRRRVVAKWREMGLTCFQVNAGPAGEKDECPHCGGTGTSGSLVGPEKEAAEALSDLCTMPTWEPHGAAAERAIKSIVKAISRSVRR